MERDGSDLWNTARIADCKGVILPVSATSAPYCLFRSLLAPFTAEAADQQQQQGPLEGIAQVNTNHAQQLTRAILVNRSPTDEPVAMRDSFLNRLGAMGEPGELPASKPEDIVVLFATSGSSGFCKLVPRTHQEILDSARSFQGGKDGRYFSDRPFGWMGGFPFDYLAYCSVRVLQVRLLGFKTKSGFNQLYQGT